MIRFTDWLVSSVRRGVTQSAYQVRVASTAAKLSAGKADIWDSGRTAGAESTQVPYAGPALTSATRYHWQVRVPTFPGRTAQWTSA